MYLEKYKFPQRHVYGEINTSYFPLKATPTVHYTIIKLTGLILIQKKMNSHW